MWIIKTNGTIENKSVREKSLPKSPNDSNRALEMHPRGEFDIKWNTQSAHTLIDIQSKISLTTSRLTKAMPTNATMKCVTNSKLARTAQ